jgi:PhnB protein
MVTETLRLYAGLQRHFYFSNPNHSQENPMQVQSYLSFEGRCEEALEFYKKAAGAEVTTLMRWSDSPDAEMKAPPGYEKKIMHAAFRIGETELMADDGMGPGTAEFKGVTLALSASSDAETKRLFDALSAGGSVQMPLTKTFWTSSFGMLRDRFGVPWMVMTASA